MPGAQRLTIFLTGCLVAVIGLAALTQSAIVSAAAATMVPDSDFSVSGWGVGVANDTTCSGGTLCDTVDEGSTDKIADYIRTTATNNGEVTFGLTNVANVDTATGLTVRVYAQASIVGQTLVDTLNVSLVVNGTPTTAQVCTPGNGSWTACTLSFSGTWSQTDVDSMQVRITRAIQGDKGKTDTQADVTWVSNVYGNLTYTPSITTAIDQSAYRWFQNADATGALSFISAYGSSSNQNGQYSIAQLNDGSYVVAGDSGTDKAVMYQYEANGDARSARSWSAIFDSAALDVAETSDGGYVGVGYLESSSGGFGGEGINQVALVKYDAAGTLEWFKTGAAFSHSVGNAVVQTADGGYAVSGSINDNSLAFIAKYDASGNLSWNKTWGGTGTDLDIGNSIAQTSDGGYVMTGMTNSFGGGSSDAFIAKYDSVGNLVWDKTWGGSGSESGDSIVQASNDNLIVTGTTSGFGAGSNDAFIAKYDASGNLTWNKTWGGTGAEKAYSVARTSDDHYVIAGLTTSFGAGGTDAFLAKYDASGNLTWNKTWGGTGSDEARSVTQTLDGGLVVTGTTGSFGAGGNDMVMLRYNNQYQITNCSPAQCETPTASESSPSASDLSPTITEEPLTLTASTSSDISFPAWQRTEIAALTPSEISTGAALQDQDTAVTISNDDILRLRLNLHISQVQAGAGSKQFKLQFAPRSSAASCSAVASATYNDVTSSSTGIRWADNANASSGLNATTGIDDPQHGSDTTVAQTYLETGTTTFNNKNAISVGQDGMWDFALVPTLPLSSETYCFRVVDASGELLDGYSQYPELTIGSSPPSIGFVDNNGDTLASPSFAMTAKDYLTSCQTSTGTLGGSDTKLRITQSGPAGNGWNVSIAPAAGDSAEWASSEGGSFDFNDGSGSPPGCFAGSDGDTYAGQLTLGGGSATLTPETGCSNDGLSLASGSTAFAGGSVSAITILSASSAASSGCYWDVMGIDLSQTIPPNQDPGSYTINLTATVTSS